jgi:hypothetical protein
MSQLVPRTRRDRLLVALLMGAVGEIAWCIYLGLALPPHYVAHHWALAWIGLDIAEVSMLFASAWAAWRQRALLILFTIVGATLVLLDAWFDVTTANHGDLAQSLVLAFFLEVPSAVALLWVARRAVTRLLLTHSVGDLSSLPIYKVALTGEASNTKSEREAGLAPEADL